MSSDVPKIGITSTIKDILNAYKTFLSNALPPVFEVDRSDPLQNPDLME
jgi:hypothetical protein